MCMKSFGKLINPANFRELTNVEGWIKESKSGYKDAEPEEVSLNMVQEHDIPNLKG